MYEVFVDASAESIFAIEAYEDSQVLLDHIAETSDEELFTPVDVGLIKVFGEPTSDIRAQLEKSGSAQIYAPLASR
jgi:hypothetical protein